MSKTFALSKRMSPYLAEQARNLIDAMLLSTEEIGWDSKQKLIVNRKFYHEKLIVRLIAYVLSQADTIFEKPIGLKVFILALKKIGLESDYVINQEVKRMLRKNNQSNNENEESIDKNSEDIKEENRSDHAYSNIKDKDDDDDDEHAKKNCSDFKIKKKNFTLTPRICLVFD